MYAEQHQKKRKLEYINHILFLYNSELWTLTKTLEKRIDSFQRRLLRNILNYHYPKIISNTELYRKAEEIPWSVNIRRRRLTWLGHALRLKEDTPARKVLKIFCTETKRPVGRPKQTWIKLVLKDIAENSNETFNNINNTNDQQLFLEELTILSQDRDKLKQMIRHMMLFETT